MPFGVISQYLQGYIITRAATSNDDFVTTVKSLI